MSSSPNCLWQQHTVSVIFRACLKSHLLTSVYWSRGHQQSMTALWDNHCCKGCEVIEKRVGPLRHSVSFSGAEANQLTGSYSWLKTSWNSETWNTLKKKMTDHSCVRLHASHHPSAGTGFSKLSTRIWFLNAKSTKQFVYLSLNCINHFWKARLDHLWAPTLILFFINYASIN